MHTHAFGFQRLCAPWLLSITYCIFGLGLREKR